MTDPIPDGDRLLRGCYEDSLFWDAARGCVSVRFDAFLLRKKDAGKLSVDWEARTTAEQSMALLQGSQGLAPVLARAVRAIESAPGVNLTVEHQPIRENPAHSVVLGLPDRYSVTRARGRRLQKAGKRIGNELGRPVRSVPLRAR